LKISDAVRAFKHRLIKGALELNDGNMRATARMLGTSRNNLIRWSKELDLFDYAAELRAQAKDVRLRRWGRTAARVAAGLVFAWAVAIHAALTVM
jgi:hypothetical protein